MVGYVYNPLHIKLRKTSSLGENLKILFIFSMNRCTEFLKQVFFILEILFYDFLIFLNWKLHKPKFLRFYRMNY